MKRENSILPLYFYTRLHGVTSQTKTTFSLTTHRLKITQYSPDIGILCNRVGQNIQSQTAQHGRETLATHKVI